MTNFSNVDRTNVMLQQKKQKKQTKGDETKIITKKWQKQTQAFRNSFRTLKKHFRALTNSFRFRPKWGARRAKLGVQPFRKTEFCNRRVKVKG